MLIQLDHVIRTLTKPDYHTYSFKLDGQKCHCVFNYCSKNNYVDFCGFLQPDTIKIKVIVDAVITDETAQERLDGLKYAKEILTSNPHLKKFVKVLTTVLTRVASISKHIYRKELKIEKENVVLVQVPPDDDSESRKCILHVVRNNNTYCVTSHECLGDKCSEQNVPPHHLEQFLKTAAQKTSSQVISGMSVIVFNGVCYIASVALHSHDPSARQQHGCDVRTTPSAPTMDPDEDDGHPSTDFHPQAPCDCVAWLTPTAPCLDDDAYDDTDDESIFVMARSEVTNDDAHDTDSDSGVSVGISDSDSDVNAGTTDSDSDADSDYEAPPSYDSLFPPPYES